MAKIATHPTDDRIESAEDRSFRMFLLAFAAAVVITGGVIAGIVMLVPGALDTAKEAALVIAIAMSKLPICH
jgi:hypothetical protein